jgi:hypothetical protein
VREIDDAQHAENERKAHAHERIDAADKNAGEDELSDRDHRTGLSSCARGSALALTLLLAFCAVHRDEKLRMISQSTTANI